MHLKLIPNTKYQIPARNATQSVAGGPNTNSGFTLIELLITIFLVSVGLIGAISFFNASLRSQFEVKNEPIAAGLAQEGSELVRNLVEYRRLNNVTWGTIAADLPSCARIDYRSLSSSHTCNNGTSNDVCFVGGRYRQCDSGTGMGMQRSLTISHLVDANGDRLEITVIVSWNDRKTEAKDVIYENEY